MTKEHDDCFILKNALTMNCVWWKISYKDQGLSQGCKVSTSWKLTSKTQRKQRSCVVVRVLSVNHYNTRRKNIYFRLVQTWCKPRLDRGVFVAHLVEHRDSKAELATFMLQIVSENLDCFFLARDKVHHPSRSLSLQQRMLPSCAKNLYSQADVYFSSQYSW